MTDVKYEIRLNGIQWIRVFSACQALAMPTGIYGITHKQAKFIICQTLGYVPPGKPGTVQEAKSLKGFRFIKSAQDYSDWLGIVDREDCRQSPSGTSTCDTVVLTVKIPARSKRL